MNLIIGILTIVIGFLSTVLAWATWKLTRDRRRRMGHMSPPIEPNELRPLAGYKLPLGYELALRIGRSP